MMERRVHADSALTMTYPILCVAVFVAFYSLSIFYVTAFYHRGFAHGALRMHPRFRRFVIQSGNWVTGLDPKAWSCMHRLHHLHSDTPLDPHSPVHYGVPGVLLAQLRSYKRTLRNLILGRGIETTLVRDLDFPVHWLNRRQLWYLPYLLHASLALAIGLVFGAWALGLAYWLGIMSHPVQGWMVNALAHHRGYRNFDTPDNSRNNVWVAWLVMGEGYQNNHHHRPSAAKFSMKPGEFDPGYALCRLVQATRLIKIREN